MKKVYAEVGGHKSLKTALSEDGSILEGLEPEPIAEAVEGTATKSSALLANDEKEDGQQHANNDANAFISAFSAGGMAADVTADGSDGEGVGSAPAMICQSAVQPSDTVVVSVQPSTVVTVSVESNENEPQDEVQQPTEHLMAASRAAAAQQVRGSCS